MRLLKEEN